MNINKFFITFLLIFCCSVPVLAADEDADIEIGLPGDITIDVDDPHPEEVVLVGIDSDVLDSLNNKELYEDIWIQNNTIICLLSLATVSIICNGVIAFTRKGKGN